MRRILSTLALLAVIACGGGHVTGIDSTGVHVDSSTIDRDPYATILVENQLTAAGSAKLATTYLLNLVFEPDSAITNRLSYQGEIGVREVACTHVGGYVGRKRLALVAVGDTLSGGIFARTTVSVDAAALDSTTLLPGMVRISTPVFDPLVSADTSRGHTRTRPVMWRWRLTDAGNVLTEDSTTACVFEG